MPLATTTEPTAIGRSSYPTTTALKLAERHAEIEALSSRRRKARGAPRRDDMARAAYYALLMFYEEAGTDADRATFKTPFVNILVKAGFAREACAALFDGHVATVLDDLDGWLKYRWIAEGERLEDGRGPYVRLPRVHPKGQRFESLALTPFLDAGTSGSAADQE